MQPHPPAADQQPPSPRAVKHTQSSRAPVTQLPPYTCTDINQNGSLQPDNHDDTQYQPELDVFRRPSTPDELAPDLTQGQTPMAPDMQQPVLSSQFDTILDDPESFASLQQIKNHIMKLRT